MQYLKNTKNLEKLSHTELLPKSSQSIRFFQGSGQIFFFLI